MTKSGFGPSHAQGIHRSLVLYQGIFVVVVVAGVLCASAAAKHAG